jgi:hypothetical protein
MHTRIFRTALLLVAAACFFACASDSEPGSKEPPCVSLGEDVVDGVPVLVGCCAGLVQVRSSRLSWVCLPADNPCVPAGFACPYVMVSAGYDNRHCCDGLRCSVSDTDGICVPQ